MVSIILPVCESEKVISRAIDSVLNQTYHDWELIIVYDNCTDRTLDIVNNYCSKDERIHCISSEKSKSPAGARNTGINYSKGKYLAFLDSNDEWIDIHLTECIDALNNTKYSLCSSLWIEEKFDKLTYIGHRFPSDDSYTKMLEDLNINRQDKLWIFDKKLFEYIIYKNIDYFKLDTIVVEKDILISLNGFNEKFCLCEDIDLIYRLLHHTPLVIINNYHNIYHFSSVNLYRNVNTDKLNINKIKQDKEVFNKLNIYLYNMILLLENMLIVIDSSKDIQDKKKAKQYLSDVIYNRCLSFSYINKKYIMKNRLFGICRAVKYFPQALKEESRLPLPGYREKHLQIS